MCIGLCLREFPICTAVAICILLRIWKGSMMLKEQGKEFFRVATNSAITDEQVVERARVAVEIALMKHKALGCI